MALIDRQANALQHGDKPVFDGKVTGLMFTPGKTGSKWTLRFTSPVTGKRRDAGLDMTLTALLRRVKAKSDTPGQRRDAARL
ncbi:hypothetical protein [Paraburkholderia oxyphila]|uniref:hypothetical protein n=1 Tax=Paraburkholderia oxyphila TaxID=614212 RepID=UPI0005BAEB02|nr:hypothetical protein [Paraburkholderia oxyphila]